MAAKDSAFASAVRRERDAEAVSYDLMKLFNVEERGKKHDSVHHQGWEPYVAEPNATIPYCALGARPLDGLEFAYGVETPWGDAEHQQMLCSDGQNFGLSKSLSSKNDVYIEDPKRLSEYIVSPVHYRKDVILKAQKAVDAEWESQPFFYNQPDCLFDVKSRYAISQYNCQHYLRDVINRAKEIASEEDVSLVIN